MLLSNEIAYGSYFPVLHFIDTLENICHINPHAISHFRLVFQSNSPPPPKKVTSVQSRPCIILTANNLLATGFENK